MSSHKRIRKSISFFDAIYLLSPLLSLIGIVCSGASLAVALSIVLTKHSQNLITELSAAATIQNQAPSQEELDKQDKSSLKPVLPHQPVPETQLWEPNYPVLDESILGKGFITGGFMEDLGHSPKPQTYAIFFDAPDQITTLPPSSRNLGIDYVVSDYNIRNWYPGTVTQVGWENGYGNRAYVQFNVQFPFNGSLYPLKGAYAHASSFSVSPGESIQQGQVIGKMGGTGGSYPDHIDFRLWIEVEGKTIDVSPNLVDASIHFAAH